MRDALVCPGCSIDLELETDPIAERPIAPAFARTRRSREVFRCQPCGIVAVVEGGKVAWYYPDASEELALLRTRTAHLEAVLAQMPPCPSCLKADAQREELALLRAAWIEEEAVAPNRVPEHIPDDCPNCRAVAVDKAMTAVMRAHIAREKVRAYYAAHPEARL